MDTKVRVRFWGVRGSVPQSTPASIGHGCNTACVDLFDETSDRRLILDAGSGIVGLGDTITASGQDVPILLTHYHWDHVLGLPHFAPFHISGQTLSVWAPALSPGAPDIEALFREPFFPIAFDRLASRPTIRVVTPGEADINGFHVRVQRLNHPGGAFAYRIRGADGDLVYATDHEFGDRAIDDALHALAADVSALILDAHFTPEESPSHRGWGHADWRECATFAKACGVGHLWLTHHMPGRTDEALEHIGAEARQVFPATTVAREGDCFSL